MQVKLTYPITPDLARRRFIKNGGEVSFAAEISFPLLTPQAREVWTDVFGFQKEGHALKLFEGTPLSLSFAQNEELTPEAAIAFLTQIAQVHQSIVDERKAKEEAYQASRRDWIQAHGSDRLRRAFELEYHIDNGYLLERAAAEAQVAVVDTAKNAKFGEVNYPTQEALSKAEAIALLGLGEPRVKWLKSKVGTLEPNREVVVVADYLGVNRLSLIWEV